MLKGKSKRKNQLDEEEMDVAYQETMVSKMALDSEEGDRDKGIGMKREKRVWINKPMINGVRIN